MEEVNLSEAATKSIGTSVISLEKMTCPDCVVEGDAVKSCANCTHRQRANTGFIWIYICELGNKPTDI